MWFFEETDGALFFSDESTSKHRLLDCLPGIAPMMVKIICSDNGVQSVREQSLARFQVEANDVSRRFRTICQSDVISRTLFVKQWKELTEVFTPGLAAAAIPTVGQVSLATQLSDSSACNETILGDKLVGPCMDVHVTNLVSPKDTRRVREVNANHVLHLQKELVNQQQVSVLVGLVDEDTDIGKLHEPYQGHVEVIGGNHSRAALRALWDAGYKDRGLVKVNVYKGLSEVEALKMGVRHNMIHDNVRKMSFLEMVDMIRKRLFGEEKKIQRRRKAELAEIFGFDTVNKMNKNYRNHLAVARWSEEAYEKVQEIGRRWEGERITQQPRKPFRQTVLLPLLSVTEDNRLQLLDVLMTEGYKTYRMAAKSRRNGETEAAEAEVQDGILEIQESESLDTADESLDTADEDINISDVSDDEMPLVQIKRKRNTTSKPGESGDDEEDASLETLRLRGKCRKLEDTVKALQSENEALRKELNSVRGTSGSRKNKSVKRNLCV